MKVLTDNQINMALEAAEEHRSFGERIMTPKQMAHEFFLGIRQAMTCPDVSVAEYENVMACKIESTLRDIEEQTRKETWAQGEAAVLKADRARVTSDGPK